jgi:hypothetical protein
MIEDVVSGGCGSGWLHCCRGSRHAARCTGRKPQDRPGEADRGRPVRARLNGHLVEAMGDAATATSRVAAATRSRRTTSCSSLLGAHQHDPRAATPAPAQGLLQQGESPAACERQQRERTNLCLNRYKTRRPVAGVTRSIQEA